MRRDPDKNKSSGKLWKYEESVENQCSQILSKYGVFQELISIRLFAKTFICFGSITFTAWCPALTIEKQHKTTQINTNANQHKQYKEKSIQMQKNNTKTTQTKTNQHQTVCQNFYLFRLNHLYGLMLSSNNTKTIQNNTNQHKTIQKKYKKNTNKNKSASDCLPKLLSVLAQSPFRLDAQL